MNCPTAHSISLTPPRTSLTHTLALTLCLWSFVVMAADILPAPLYRLQYIPGMADNYGAWLNNSAQVVAGNKFWSGTALATLPGLGGNASYVQDINDQGQIVGRSRDTTGTMQAALWQNGSASSLPNLGGQEGYATGINKHGQIVGYTDNVSAPSVINFRATFWPVPTTARDVGALPGNGASIGSAINNLGQVAGTSSPATGSSYNNGAFFWDGSLLTPIVSGVDSSQITVGGLNDQGQVVGSYMSTAFVWQAGTRLSLGTLGGGSSIARGINQQGQIVGSSSSAAGVHAFVFLDGQMLDLNNVVENLSDWASLQVAYDINDMGQIVGVGQRKGGISSTEVFVLTPIPEPTILALLLPLGALAAWSRRGPR